MPPDFFPPWDQHFVDGRTQNVAIADFRAMARKDAKPEDNAPNLAALNPTSPSRTLNIRFTLEGIHRADNHFLFKEEADLHSRRNAGLELPEDFKPERAARIGFIALTLLKPKWVYLQSRDNSRRHVYVSRTASDEYFAVIIDTKEREEPKYEFWTAFEMNEMGLNKYRANWTLLYSEKAYLKKLASQSAPIPAGKKKGKK